MIILKVQAKITGGDFSEELLGQGRAEASGARRQNIRFSIFGLQQDHLNLQITHLTFCTSAFAIYYASDLDFTFGEAHRVLKPGGRLFVSGPLPENKQMFYDIIKEATNQPSRPCRLLPLQR